MKYFLLGHFYCGAVFIGLISWLRPEWASSMGGWALLSGFFGEFVLLAGGSDSEFAEIRKAIDSGAMSPWFAFAGGALGTFLWVSATSLIWIVRQSWESEHADELAWVLSVVAYIVGISVGLAIVSVIAKMSNEDRSRH